MAALGSIIMAFMFFAPLINHVVFCIQKADETGSAIALLLVGIAFFPVGWAHGISAFFGYGWI